MGVPLNVVTAGGDTNGSPATQSYTLAAGSNRLLVVALTCELNADNSGVFGVSFGGVPLIQEAGYHANPGGTATFHNFVGIYSLAETNFPVGETEDVVFTYPAGATAHVGVTIMTLADMAQAAAEDTNAEGDTTNVATRILSVTPTSSDPIIIGVSAVNAPSSFTEQVGQTELSDFSSVSGVGLSHTHSARYKQPGAAGSTTVTSAAANGARHAVAVAAFGEFDAGGGTVTGTGVTQIAGVSASSAGAVEVQGTGVTAVAGAMVSAAGTAQTPADTVSGSGVMTIAGPIVRGWSLAISQPDLTGIGDAFILEVGVPYSVNSIINGALDLIASNGIASLSDSSSHVGNAIKRNFDVERDSLLREYPWNFAMRRAKLAASSEAPAFRFRRAYELPAGPKPEFCLRVWAVGNEENRQDSDVWEISGRRLLTDLEAPLPIRYIGRIVNPALWDPLTIKALEARLAWQAAYLASGSAALAEQIARIYQERLDAAKAIDAQEGTPEPFEDGTTWVDSRLTGASW